MTSCLYALPSVAHRNPDVERVAKEGVLAVLPQVIEPEIGCLRHGYNESGEDREGRHRPVGNSFGCVRRPEVQRYAVNYLAIDADRPATLKRIGFVDVGYPLS